MRKKINNIINALVLFRLPLLVTIIVLIFIEIFFVNLGPDLFVLLLLPLWVLTLILWKLDGSFSILLSLMFLSISILTLFFTSSPLPEKAQPERALLWSYLFLTVGCLRKILTRKKDNLATLSTVLKSIKAFYLSKMPEISITENDSFKTDLKNKISFLAKMADIFLGIIFKIVFDWTRNEMKLGKIFLSLIVKKILSREIVEKIKNFVIKFVFDSFLLHLIILFFIFKKLYLEIIFYQNFFLEEWKGYFNDYLFWSLVVVFFVSICFFVLVYFLRSYLPKKTLVSYPMFFSKKVVNFFLRIAGLKITNEKSIGKKITYSFSTVKKGKYFFITVFLLLVYFCNKSLYSKRRDKFEFYPYITKVLPFVSPKYSSVSVLGHNFKEIPFVGKVYINDKVQRIQRWSDKEIIIEIDPFLSETGDLVVVNDYGFGKNVISNKRKFIYYDSQTATLEEQQAFWKSLMEKAKNKP